MSMDKLLREVKELESELVRLRSINKKLVEACQSVLLALLHGELNKEAAILVLENALSKAEKE